MTHTPSDNLGRGIQAIYPGVCQPVTVTGPSAPCANPFGADTTVLRIACTVGCHYALGLAPVATTNDPWLPAGVVEYIEVSRGQKIAFIPEGAVSGTAYATEGK
jgi:hypothetical protein